MRRRPTKVGIIVDSLIINSWKEKIIQEVLSSEIFKLSIVIVTGDTTLPHEQNPLRILKGLDRFLYDTYTQWDYKYYCRFTKKNSFKKIDLTPLLIKGDTKIVEAKSEGRKADLSREQANEIDKEKPDVIIQLGSKSLGAGILRLAEHGVWSYSSNEWCTKAFWAMFGKKHPFTTSLNVLKSNRNEEVILYETTSSMNFESLFLNRNFMYWKVASIICEKLKSLHNDKLLYLQKNCFSVEKVGEGKAVQKKIPNNAQMLIFLSRLLVHKLKARLIREQWYLAYKNKSQSSDVFTLLHTQGDRFYADPFVMRQNEKNYVFFEEYVYREGKGIISFIEMDVKKGLISKPVKVLDKPYHLSYPFLMEDKGNIYMIPETSENKTIELYKAKNFPYEWELEKVLMSNINAVDSTILFHQNKYWLFTNVFADGASSLDELHLFFSDSLYGEWEKHPMNPIVSDSRTARPAGNLFFREGKLLRPSQNCQFTYGYSVNFNEVEILTEKEYKECKINEIVPEVIKNNKGTHTYVFNDEIELVDCRKPILKIF
ncbi:hypothetical protein CEF21_15410 [Bacillus sp. FJAT-42376]|uniref:glucosamine inositolphosphorylceramide transferase family protein n=1 Tax=Bacillus sp. FJAT-42376 TaxID=2014076 RepID=UPI000F50BAB1|nr:hypothetical protein [Bacillus sp. FJAT-42376]AZB43581.1 hypothetical protein CEF21_15410 [Bacillus sp. FJAT-42376]